MLVEKYLKTPCPDLLFPFSQVQSGLMIDWRFSLVLALPISNKDNQM